MMMMTDHVVATPPGAALVDDLGRVSPTAGDQAKMVDEPSLEDLVGRWERAIGRGEPPSISEICGDCPEMVASLERELIAREFTRIGIVELDDAGRAPPRVHDAPEGLVAGAEPVHGYRLVRPIGRGGSGEVWEAIGPGGIPVAIKFVKVAEGPDAPPTVHQRRLDSLRSLLLIREVRHPNLLPLFGVWSRDGLLILVMELAERTLQDRFDEATRAGESGLPVAELIAYMQQAAGGIDFLNGNPPGPGIQHGDVKPQNLLLVGGCVKVGDFGQAIRPGDFGTIPGSSTSSFAAPELSRGVMSARSDQYALAVSYCLLRGGRLPFEGGSLEVMMGHFRETPDLSMIPEAERPAVARALAKDPAERWPDCRSFVEAITRPANLRRGAAPARPGGRARRPIGSLPGPVRAALIALVPLAALVATVALTPKGQEPEPPPARESLPALVAEEGPVTVPRRVVAVGPGESAAAPSPPIDPEVARAADGQRTAPGPELAGSALSQAPPQPEPPPKPPVVSVAVEASNPPAPRAAVVEEPRPAVEAKPPVIGVAKANPTGLTPSAEPAPTPPLEQPRRPMTASISVFMPTAKAELVVKGEVGRGNPDEWYGPTRVIHTPPMDRPEEYIVGSFWMDEANRPLTRSRKLRVEPGKAYEVDLRPGVPTARETPKPNRTNGSTPGKLP